MIPAIINTVCIPAIKITIDWSHAKRGSFPQLKPSTKTISLRLPEDLLNSIKTLANKEDVPYQSLMKILLSRGINIFKRDIKDIK